MHSSSREHVLAQLSNHINAIKIDRPIRVAIDGRTASGKTTLSDELAATLTNNGRAVIRSSVDGFHQPKAKRYARGRHSPEGYYYDARDLSAIVTYLLEPLGNQGNLRYSTANFDLEKDQYIDRVTSEAPRDAILLVDGTFLQRPELNNNWDLRIFVKTSVKISEKRGIERDVQQSGDIETISKLYQLRYRPAYNLYESRCNPEDGADIIWVNNDISDPELIFNNVSENMKYSGK